MENNLAELKKEFVDRWKYQQGKGYGSASFDLGEQLTEDLNKLLNNYVPKSELDILSQIKVCLDKQIEHLQSDNSALNKMVDKLKAENEKLLDTIMSLTNSVESYNILETLKTDCINADITQARQEERARIVKVIEQHIEAFKADYPSMDIISALLGVINAIEAITADQQSCEVKDK